MGQYLRRIYFSATKWAGIEMLADEGGMLSVWSSGPPADRVYFTSLDTAPGKKARRNIFWESKLKINTC